MRTSTRLMIGGVLLATGIAVAALAFMGGEDDVRQVADVLAAPQQHTSGTYTLLGVPEPPLVPVQTASGQQLKGNPDAVTVTTSVVAWQRNGQTVHSTLRLEATQGTNASAEDGASTRFHYSNHTRFPGQTEDVLPPVESTWSSDGHVFGVRGFTTGVAPPSLWVVYDGALKDPLQPKPSQFVGHLATTTPDGRPLPEGAYIFLAHSYTAGCSSKFVPPEEQARLEAKYNGPV